MFKKVIRLGILAMLVVSVMFGAMGVKPAAAITVSGSIDIYTMNQTWNGSLDWDTWNWDASSYYDSWENDPSMTVGELKQLLEAELGYPVDLLIEYKDDSYPVHPSDSATLADFTCSSGNIHGVYVFKVSHGKNARLTLYGYDVEGAKSCVLYSLDGSKPINVNDKCGGNAELVCTVKLIGKDLVPDCAEGHERMGFNISHDSKWLSWADKFARRYKR